MRKKNGWSAFEYILVTVAVIAAIVVGSQRLREATERNIFRQKKR